LLCGVSFPKIADIRRMKHAILFFVLLVTLFSCDPKSSPEAPTVLETPAVSPTPTVPEPSEPTAFPEEPVLLSADFNGDGAADFLEIRMTGREDRDLGKERDLVVYSGAGNTRKNWYVAKSVLLSTESGGMMGDPLEGVDIVGNTILIKHFGGSRQKWTYTHRFRWQNGDFQLIGVTVNTGAPCDYFEDFDYNLSTGDAEWVKTTEDCSESEEDRVITEVTHSFNEKPTVRVSMNGFRTGEYALKIPNMDESVYF
jgi:hypothetical protein